MKKVILTLCAVAALAACQKTEIRPYVGDSSRPVVFSVENIYSIETKADPIANGKQVGIYAGAPISKDNVAFNVTMTSETAGTLAPAVTNSLLWGVGQTTQATNFLAVYPYASERTLTGAEEANKYFEYAISDAENVDYADKFLTAVASQAPGTGETPAKVALAFSHPFAKLLYNIDNQTDDYVAGVKISGIHRSGKIMFISGAAVATGDAVAAEDAIALNEITPNASYMTVVMPETSAVNPVVTVNMVSGAKYTFSLAAGVALAAGKVYTASITLSGSHGTEESDRTMLGTFTVTDWANVDAGAMTGGVTSEATKWWYLEGNIDEVGGTEDGNWNKHIPLKCIAPTVWTVDFYYAGGTDIDSGFKVRYAADASDWEDSWGKDVVIEAAGITAEGTLLQGLSQGGPNMRIDAVGKYRINFYTDTHDFHIYKID